MHADIIFLRVVQRTTLFVAMGSCYGFRGGCNIQYMTNTQHMSPALCFNVTRLDCVSYEPGWSISRTKRRLCRGGVTRRNKQPLSEKTQIPLGDPTRLQRGRHTEQDMIVHQMWR